MAYASSQLFLQQEKISQALRENSVEAMSGQQHITLIHDPCDIRKEYSKELENLGKVLDLDKNVVNGYYTFKSKAIDDDGKRWNDVDTKVYSNREPQFVSQEELKLYNKGTLQNSKNTERRERAEIIQQLVDADDYINTSEVN